MNSSNNQTRAVLWDLDGTLIDSMPYHWETWNDVLQPLGCYFSIEAFLQTMGMRNVEIVRDFLKLDRPQTEIERIVLSKEIRYRELLRERGLPLLPGVEHWLKTLRADGWRHAIVTSAPRLNVEATIYATHLDRVMDTIVCAEDVINGKPDPEPFLLAADRLGVSPVRCIVVEDAPAGLEGARRAGMKSIGVLTTHAALEANRVVKSLIDLTEDAFDKVMSDE
ncbi:MAG TPA: HAD family phosphatase [Anaerolineae bacterium]|jgi:beta-phosphoglucomutase family hydrolase|nr:HAD family phosphatase [Anaerolineae bacterium]